MDLKKVFESLTNEESLGKLKAIGEVAKKVIMQIAEEIQNVDGEEGLTGVEKRKKVTQLVIAKVIMPAIKALPIPVGAVTDRVIKFLLDEFLDDLVEIVYQLLVTKFKK